MTAVAKPAAPPEHPVVQRLRAKRAEDAQLRIADAITKFAGSMAFVYLHLVMFALWMLVIEKSPWPTLTLIVSLEAIFLSTFVMISQNRADAKRQVIADHQWKMVQEEDQQNVQLLEISRQILALTKDVHDFAATAGARGGTAQAPARGKHSP